MNICRRFTNIFASINKFRRNGIIKCFCMSVALKISAFHRFTYSPANSNISILSNILFTVVYNWLFVFVGKIYSYHVFMCVGQKNKYR